MTTLTDKLEAVAEGSRELDEAIHRVVAAEEYTIRHEPLGWPHYSQSLDAKLPGENIVMVRGPGYHHQPNDSPSWEAAPPEFLLWEAAALCEKEGKLHFGYAHTEALARRVAALRARDKQ